MVSDSIPEVLNSIFSDSTSLYFYSALFQGNAALITLTAMYTIYRRQDLDSAIDKKEANAMEFLARATGTFSMYSDFDVYKTFSEDLFKGINEKQKSDARKVIEDPAWGTRFGEIKDLKDMRDTLWNNSKPSLKSLLFAIIAAMLALPFTKIFHIFQPIELILFLTFISWEIFTLYELYHFMRSSSQQT